MQLLFQLCIWENVCLWVSRFCRGCTVECTEDRASVGNAYIAVDWDPTALHLRYQTSQERVRDTPPSLHLCLHGCEPWVWSSNSPLTTLSSSWLMKWRKDPVIHKIILLCTYDNLSYWLLLPYTFIKNIIHSFDFRTIIFPPCHW